MDVDMGHVVDVVCWQCDVFWLLFFFVTALYVCFWFYCVLVAENSMADIDWYDQFIRLTETKEFRITQPKQN